MSSEKNQLLEFTIRTPSYEKIDDILFNLDNLSRFIWITGRVGVGKTHAMNYIYSRMKKKKGCCVINTNFNSRVEDNYIKELNREIINELKKKHKKVFLNIKFNEVPEISKEIKSNYEIKRFILLIDGLDKEIIKFLNLFNRQNQGCFERLVDNCYSFIITANGNYLKQIGSEYYLGETVRIEPFITRGQIRNFIRLIEKDYDPSSQVCLKLLEKSNGIPSKIMDNIKYIKDEEERLRAIHNKFIVNNLRKIDEICNKFTDPDFRDRLIEWLKIFPEQEDKTLALKLVEFIDYYDGHKIRKDLFEGYNLIKKEISPRDEWKEIIVCSSGNAGKSGEYILYRLRGVVNLDVNQCCHLYQLKERVFDEIEAIIFIDDFIGTGDQCSELWHEISYIPDSIEKYLFVLSGLKSGIEYAQKNTEFKILCMNILGDDKKIFSDENKYFTHEEKYKLLTICQNLGGNLDLGYGNSQVCVVFDHTTPNNTIKLIRGGNEFQGLFPRRGM